MKKRSKVMFFLISALPFSLFAHDGHVHSGTFLEIFAHFMVTNAHIYIPIMIAGYFLIRALKSKQKVSK